MKRNVVIGISIVGGLLVLLLLAPFLIPASAYKSQIENAVAGATGRDFKINGALRLTYWPVLGLDAQDVTLANAPGGVAPYFLRAKSVAIGLAAAPLLRGDVQVKKLVATEPNIALEANPGGKPNWVFEPNQKERQKADQSGGLKSFGLGDVRVVKGALSFADGKGSVRAFSDIDMKVSLPSLDQPLVVDGALTMNKETLDVTLAAARPRAFLNKGQTPLNATIKGALLNAGLDGSLDVATGAISGALKAAGPSVRRLSTWAGSPMPPGPGLGAFEVAGKLGLLGKDIALKDAAIKLDAALARGDLKINTSNPVLYATGALAFEALDLNVYAPAPAAGASRGVNVAQGWPKTPIDASGLKSINADLALTTKTLLFQRYRIDSAKLNINLSNGVMNAGLADLRLYGGKGSGVVVLDASQKGRIAIAPKVVIEGLQAHPFLMDAIGLDKIEGAGTLTLDLKGAGSDTDALMKSLSGKASFNFADGAVRGVNLAQIARTVQSAISGQAAGATAKTDFAEMAASFNLTNGVAATSDFRLLNPYLRVTGKGGIDIGQQTFNFRIDPKAVKAAEGQGGQYDMGGIGVPFIMKGPWSKPSFAPDLGDLIKNEAAKQLDKLFGKKEDSSGAPSENPLSGLLQGLGASN